MHRWLDIVVGLMVFATPIAAQRTPVAPSPAAPGPAANGALLVAGEWLATNLDAPRLILLHIGRSREAYLAGHIPRARFVPLSALVVVRDDLQTELPQVAKLQEVFEQVGVSDDSHVVLYGELDGLAAAWAFFTLDHLGHQKVSLLDGGLESWTSAGRGLSSAKPPPERGVFSPRPRPDRLAPTAWIRERLDNPTVVLIDARPAAEFSGELPGGGVMRPGHIPGARSYVWRRALASESDSRLKHPRELHSAFRSAGAVPGRTVVVYCRTGLQASHAYFVARYLNLDVKLYDGSFLEWSRKAELPVSRQPSAQEIPATGARRWARWRQ